MGYYGAVSSYRILRLQPTSRRWPVARRGRLRVLSGGQRARNTKTKACSFLNLRGTFIIWKNAASTIVHCKPVYGLPLPPSLALSVQPPLPHPFSSKAKKELNRSQLNICNFLNKCTFSQVAITRWSTAGTASTLTFDGQSSPEET